MFGAGGRRGGLWPIFVWGLGIFLVGFPLLMWVRGRRKPGLGGMLLPGFPVLTTGSLLLAASVFDAWELWAWAWPLEIIALAVGFLAFALYAKVIWLWLPAIVIGANGLLFQFCALTGWWEVWAVMWTIEPLSLGIAFLVVNLKQRSNGAVDHGPDPVRHRRARLYVDDAHRAAGAILAHFLPDVAALPHHSGRRPAGLEPAPPRDYVGGRGGGVKPHLLPALSATDRPSSSPSDGEEEVLGWW